MKLYQGETASSSYELLAIGELAKGIVAASKSPVTVIAVDGRSGGGKTTVARKLAKALNASLLSTDDFAWWHSFFDWPQMLIENAITPLRAGQAIAYRPDAWVERAREGCIEAQPASFVIVEGVGALQEEMRAHVDLGIWVQSDSEEAKRRGLLRDLAERPDPIEAERFWNEWQQAENEFQQQQQSWLQAEWWVCGTPSALGLEDAGEGFLAAAKNSKPAC